MKNKLLKRSILGIIILSGAVLSILLLWEIFPALILKPYNNLTWTSVTVNGQAILDQNSPEYVDAPSKSCFKPVEVDAEYNSEGASVADINRDGLNDIVTGHYWYQAPGWQRHTIRSPLHKAIVLPKPSDYIKAYFAEKGVGIRAIGSNLYPLAFFSFPQDINNDGWVDIIVGDVIFAKDNINWLENPKGQNGEWKQHAIAAFSSQESPIFSDILNIGTPQVIADYSDEKGPYGTLAAIEPLGGKPVFHPIAGVGTGNGDNYIVPKHGLGSGDINGDGLRDLIIGPGFEWVEGKNRPSKDGAWYEQQTTPDGERSWKRHVVTNMPAFSEIQVMDINEDGKADFVGGVAHDRGLFWFEQLDNDQWKAHVIDDTYTQLHALIQADINGDGVNDIITGKTSRAHLGMLDPDEFGTPVLYWYEKQQTQEGRVHFVRHLINDEIGIGRQITAKDINDDGLMDIAVSSRNGVHIFIQQLSSPECK